VLAWHRQDQASRRLATIPGVGAISATALTASVSDPVAYRSGRGRLRFVRHGPTSKLFGRQGEAGEDLEDGRSLPQEAARGRRETAPTHRSRSSSQGGIYIAMDVVAAEFSSRRCSSLRDKCIAEIMISASSTVFAPAIGAVIPGVAISQAKAI